MLSPKELEIIQVGADKGKTKAEIAAALAKYNSTVPAQTKAVLDPMASVHRGAGGSYGVGTSVVDRAKDAFGDIKETGTAIKNTFNRSVDRQREILDAGAGEQGALSTGFQTTMNFLGTLGGLTGDVIMGAGKVAISQDAEERIKAKTQELAQPIYESAPVQEWISRYKALEKENPEMARNVVALAQGGEFLLNFLGLKAAKTAGEAIITGSEKAFVPVVGKLDAQAKNAAIIANKLKTETPIVATQVGEAVIGKPGAIETLFNAAKNKLSRIPSRAKTNVAAMQATEDVIQTLPSDVAKTAARDGVNPSDIKTLYTLPKEQAPAYQKLVDTTKKYAAGDKAVDPVEIVGEPMVARIKELEAAKKEIGKKLGEAAENLGKVTREELQPAIFNKLKSVKGLEGLKLTPAGELDFTGTVLATQMTLADRKAIRAIYKSAVSNGSGKSKHLLRQELYEVLGGQKGISAMTETQDRAYQAVRQGLADVLDTKNATYKALNAEYAKVANPLKELDSSMRFSKLDDGLAMGANEDLYNMAAGLLARRITSLAKSNPEIMALLRSMDTATAKAGKTAVSVEAMQNLYNVLNNYYDISPKTGFQGQIKGALENTGSLTGEALKGLKGLTGETPAVRQKALESVLDELFPKAEGAIPLTSLKSNFKSVDEMIRVAPESKNFIDEIATGVAKENGVKVAVAPLKTPESIARKISAELDGDFNKLKDLARNTIVLTDEAKYGSITKALETKGAKIKVQAPEQYMGYSGTIANITTPNGLIAEIQITTPTMIFGKMPVEDSVKILGQDVVDRIARETGLEAGRGHIIYEQYRVLSPAEQRTAKGLGLKQESIDYYSKLQ